MIDLQKKKRYFNLCLYTLLVLCIAAYFVVFAIINFFGFIRYCDYDMYADTLVAKLMWEQKTLFPQGWVFGNQLYVLATPVLAALFYGITGNSNLAMVIATEVMTILTFISFLWLVRAFSKNPMDYLVFCLIFLFSVIAPHGARSHNAQLFFLLASYYSCYLITLAVVLGDYVRSIQSSMLRPIALTVSLILSFAMGMQSIRQTVIMVLPILACELLYALRRFIRKEPLWNHNNVHTLIRVVSYAIANLFGFFFVKFLNVPQTTIFGDFQLISYGNLTTQLSEIHDSFLGVTRLDSFLQPDVSSVFRFLSLAAVLVFLVALFLWLRGIQHSESPIQACWIVCLLGVFGVILSSVVFNVHIRSIYLFTWYPLIAFSGLIIFKRFSLRSTWFAVVLVCALGFGNLRFSYVPSAISAINSKPNDADAMCSWATDNGYEYVYGNCFTAPQIAIPSEGKLDAGYWWDAIYHPLGYINMQNIYGPDENSKAIYVFTSEDVAQGLQIAQDEGAVLTKVAEFGDYYAYTSSTPLLYQKSKSYG